MLIGRLLWLGLLLSARAHAVGVVYWDSCVREVMEKNPDLLAAQNAVLAAKAGFKASLGDYFPSLTGTLQKEQTNIIFRDSSLNTGISTVYRWGGNVNWNAFSGFSTLGANLSSYHSLKQAQSNYRRASVGLRFDLRQAFGNLLFLQDQLRLLREIASRRATDADLVSTQYKSGVAARWSALESSARLKEAEWQLFDAENALRAAQRRLLAVLGRPQYEEIQAAGELEAPSPPSSLLQAVEKSLVNHPDVVLQKEGLGVAKGQSLQAQSPFWPSANLAYSQLYQDTSWPPAGIRSWDLTLGLSWRIFAGGSIYHGLKEAQARVKLQEKVVEAAQNQVSAAAEDSYARYRSAYGRLGVDRELVQAEAEREETLRAEYLAGRAGYFEWNTAVNAHADTQKAELSTRLNAYLSWGAWERSAGVDLEGKPDLRP